MEEPQMDTTADAAPTLPAPMPGRSVLQQLSKREIGALDPETRLQLEEDHRQMIAQAEAAKDARRAEVVAQVALAPLEVDEHENLHDALIRSLEGEASSAFESARAVVGLSLDAERNAMRAAAGNLPRYAGSLRAHATRWRAMAALSADDAALLAGAMPQVPQPPTDPASKIVAARGAAGITPAGFNAAGFLTQLAARGVQVAADGGDLLIRGQLDHEGRRQLAAHKPAILAALSAPAERI